MGGGEKPAFSHHLILPLTFSSFPSQLPAIPSLYTLVGSPQQPAPFQDHASVRSARKWDSVFPGIVMVPRGVLGKS